MKTESVKEEQTQNRPNQWKKKKKKKKKRRNPEQIEPVKEEEEEKNRIANPGEEREKKSQKVVKRCGLVLFVGPLCVFNYNIAIGLWVIESENNQNVFSVSIIHNSKIRKLSDGNKVMDSQTTFLLWVPPFLSYELWKLRYELWKLLNQTPP